MDRQGLFDYILLETTGLADPGNIAPLFWVDDGLGSSIYLDGIVTLVDAKNVLRSLDKPNEDEAVHDGHGEVLSTAHLQISHADVVVINKADLVTDEELMKVEDRVRSINALANVKVTDHSRVPQLEGLVLDLHAYDNVPAEDLDFSKKGHSHLDPSIGTVTLEFPSLKQSELETLDEWLRSVLWESKLPGIEENAAWEIHRTKGRIPLADGRLMVLQGVREIFEVTEAEVASSSSAASNEGGEHGKIVLIGRNISTERTSRAFHDSLRACLTR